MEQLQDTAVISTHLDRERRPDPMWARVCLWFGIPFLLLACSYMTTILAGRLL